jgi:hypothetical protein
MNNHQEETLNMEFRLWSLLDGDCSEAERQNIVALLASNDVWKQKYEELQQLHISLGMPQEMEQPSMRFTQNIMEAVASEKILRPVNSYLNHWVIRGIAAFFLLIIGYYFFGLLSNIDWNYNRGATSPGLLAGVRAPNVSMQSMIYGTLLLSIVAGLMLVDAFIRRKRLQNL